MPYQIDSKNCKKSGLCIQECPVDAIIIEKSDGRYQVDPDLCTDCGSCADICPEGAIEGIEI